MVLVNVIMFLRLFIKLLKPLSNQLSAMKRGAATPV
jgi:hypothetical protein